MSIWTVIAEGTMKAACQHLLHQNEQNIDADKLTNVLRATLKEAIPELQEELQAMNDAMMSEQQLRWALNVHCNSLAAKAIASYRS